MVSGTTSGTGLGFAFQDGALPGRLLARRVGGSALLSPDVFDDPPPLRVSASELRGVRRPLLAQEMLQLCGVEGEGGYIIEVDGPRGGGAVEEPVFEDQSSGSDGGVARLVWARSRVLGG
ncbi:MAG: hypothetical protein ABSF69_26990 [Polyangiaceae bacterium]